MSFSISSVSEIKWNDSAFESLVLPSDHKELILALTESQVANKDSFDDVIQGKGMYPPLRFDTSFCGVGHTAATTILSSFFEPEQLSWSITVLLTNINDRARHDHAPERPTWSRKDTDSGIRYFIFLPPKSKTSPNKFPVAENMRAPLYMRSAGDLGLDSHNVESSLSNVLEMSTKWNAVLLLDEADVFLEQRSAHDLERNKLVSSTFSPHPYLFPIFLAVCSMDGQVMMLMMI